MMRQSPRGMEGYPDLDVYVAGRYEGDTKSD